MTDTTPSAPADAFHIAFCVDNHYFRSMGATMTSIIDNNPGLPLVFHVFAFDASPEERERLRRLEERYGVTTRLHLVDMETFRDFRHFIGSSHYSLSIFSRLIIPTVLRGITDRVLYLDADILCVGSIDELVRMDLHGEIAAVVPDAGETTRRRVAALGLPHHEYFNGGVLYMNVENWLAQHVTEDAMRALVEYGSKLRFNDQDALNIVLNGRARWLDRRYNVLYDLIHDLNHDRRQMRPVGDAVFIHFAGAVKPWTEWSLHESRALFEKYHAMSPWGDLPLDALPRNTKEMRMHSRFLFRRGKVVESLGWYLKYLQAHARKKQKRRAG